MIWSATAFASTCCGCGIVGAGVGGATGTASCTNGIANESAGCVPDGPETATALVVSEDVVSPLRLLLAAGVSVRASALANAWTNASSTAGFAGGAAAPVAVLASAGAVWTTFGGRIPRWELPGPAIGTATGVVGSSPASTARARIRPSGVSPPVAIACTGAESATVRPSLPGPGAAGKGGAPGGAAGG